LTAKANLRDWWTKDDRKNFDERATCVQKQFDSYEVEPGLHENGKLVLGESIADLGGLAISYAAYENRSKESVLRILMDYSRATVFSRLGASLGFQSASRIRTANGQQQSASRSQIPREWAALQYGTIRQGIWLQKRRAHGPRKCLQDLVIAGIQALRVRSVQKLSTLSEPAHKNMKTILVTGSNGLIGSEAVEHFDRQGHRVIGVDNNMRQIFFGTQGDTTWNLNRLKRSTKNFQHVNLDIRDRNALDELFKIQSLRIDCSLRRAAFP